MGVHRGRGVQQRIVERKGSHRHFCSLGLPDTVGVSHHGLDIGEVVGRDLAAHLSRE